MLLNIIILLVLHMQTETCAEGEEEPSFKTIGLELLSFPLLPTTDCSSVCKERGIKLAVYLLNGFQGPNLMVDERQYSSNPLRFWIDRCLARRLYCLVNADVWLTNEKPDFAAAWPSDETDRYALMKQHAQKGFRRAAETQDQAECGLNQKSESYCICRRILYLQVVRNILPQTMNGNSIPENERSNIKCESFDICERLGEKLKLMDPSIGLWFCTDGFLNKKFDQKVKNSKKQRRDTSIMCPCPSSYVSLKEKLKECVSEAEFRDAMQAASLVPLQIRSVTTYEVPSLQIGGAATTDYAHDYNYDASLATASRFDLESLYNLDSRMFGNQYAQSHEIAQVRQATRGKASRYMEPSQDLSKPIVSPFQMHGQPRTRSPPSHHEDSLEILTRATTAQTTSGQTDVSLLSVSFADELSQPYQQFIDPVNLAVTSETLEFDGATGRNIDSFVMLSSEGSAEASAKIHSEASAVHDRRGKRKMDDHSTDWQSSSLSLPDLDDAVSRYFTDPEPLDLDAILRDDWDPSATATVTSSYPQNVQSPLADAVNLQADETQEQTVFQFDPVQWPL